MEKSGLGGMAFSLSLSLSLYSVTFYPSTTAGESANIPKEEKTRR